MRGWLTELVLSGTPPRRSRRPVCRTALPALPPPPTSRPSPPEIRCGTLIQRSLHFQQDVPDAAHVGAQSVKALPGVFRRTAEQRLLLGCECGWSARRARVGLWMMTGRTIFLGKLASSISFGNSSLSSGFSHNPSLVVTRNASSPFPVSPRS
jgi:hypothetical protein